MGSDTNYEYHGSSPEQPDQPHYQTVHPANNELGRASRNRLIIPIALAIGCLPWLILLGLVLIVLVGVMAGVAHGPHIALIRISGTIITGQSGGTLFGDMFAGSEDIVAQLDKARKNRTARGIILRINSPGGSAAGSQEIYNAIMRVRKAGKLVYCSMGSVAASGGYYIASACDKIFADGSTITGSIGVIFETADMSALFRKIGLNPQVIKSGKFKDIGSPSRPMTPEERKLLTNMLMGIYEQFVRDVANGRQLPVPEVRKIADGRLLTGEQAMKAKLVDSLGGLQEATNQLARDVGIKGEPEVVEYGRKGILGLLLGVNEHAGSIGLLAERLLHTDVLPRVK
ncbi:MAG: signal peptide peptidase SppA [Armatimonadota bacterium]